MKLFRELNQKVDESSKLQHWLTQHEVDSVENLISVWHDVRYDKIWNSFPKIYAILQNKYEERKERSRNLRKRFFQYSLIIFLLTVLLALIYQSRKRSFTANDILQQELYKKISNKQKNLVQEKKLDKYSIQTKHSSAISSIQYLYKQIDDIKDFSESKWVIIGEHFIHIQIQPGAGIRFLDLNSRKTYNLNRRNLSQHQSKIHAVRSALKQFVNELYTRHSINR